MGNASRICASITTTPFYDLLMLRTATEEGPRAVQAIRQWPATGLSRHVADGKAIVYSGGTATTGNDFRAGVH